jgi:peptidoglycan/xylan/chitin deacetylase (PgdA/CDA1 family)
MKAIMYHYVRPDDSNFPFFRHLNVNNFVKQLDYFDHKYGFINKNDFYKCFSTAIPVNGVLLTFDDGLKDHYSFVLQELLKRKIFGIFYIPTSPITTNKILDVHRIHLLLGKYGGEFIFNSIRKIISAEMFQTDALSKFNTISKNCKSNEEYSVCVKNILNSIEVTKSRQMILDVLMNNFFPNENDLVQELYMTKTELSYMHDNGMVLGSHTVNHPIMSDLDTEEQNKEISDSYDALDSITGKTSVKTFCYPHGGFNTFTVETEKLLTKHSCLFAFNVESRNINKNDLLKRPQALPRFDCNEFPYGSCNNI